MNKEFKIKKILMAIEEDMIKRPFLFRFLNKIKIDSCKIYKDISYGQISNIFWEAFSKLTIREREIVLDYMVFNISATKSSIRNELSRRTVENYRMRTKKKLNHLIVNYLEVERILIDMKKRKLKR